MICSRRYPHIGRTQPVQRLKSGYRVSDGRGQDNAVDPGLVDQLPDLLGQIGRPCIRWLGKQPDALLDAAFPDARLDLMDVVGAVVVLDQSDLVAALARQNARHRAWLEIEPRHCIFDPLA